MKKFKGDLKGFPEEIVDKMLDYQEQQGNKRDVSVFENSRKYGRMLGGFEWGKTEEGFIFWDEIITNKKFDLFFEKPQKTEARTSQKEFRHDLKGFPVEIVDKMLDYQEEQGNKRDVSVFEERRWRLKMFGGFDWNKTEEGYIFWLDVIVNKNFDVFFEKYPKKQIIMKKFKGDLKGFPVEVVNKMLYYQGQQHGKSDVSVFEKHRWYSWCDGGFDWEDTKEGRSFWIKVITNKNFDVFFEKYPKKQTNMKKFKGQLEGFPVEIVNKMLDYQEEQGNKRDVSVFERNKWQQKMFKGFDWNKTEEGLEFWNKVLANKNFDLFFEKYPKPISTDDDFFTRAYASICKMQQEKDKRYGGSALEPLNIFAKHLPYGSRLDEKLARIKNSDELRKNDIADIIGGCMLICKDKGWDYFEDLID